jgi:hypothetical protein
VTSREIRGPQETRVELDVFFPAQAYCRERRVHKVAQLVRFSCCNDIIARRVLLKHQPHCLDVLRSPPPVSLYLEIAEQKFFAAAL